MRERERVAIGMTGHEASVPTCSTSANDSDSRLAFSAFFSSSLLRNSNTAGICNHSSAVIRSVRRLKSFAFHSTKRLSESSPERYVSALYVFINGANFWIDSRKGEYIQATIDGGAERRFVLINSSLVGCERVDKEF